MSAPSASPRIAVVGRQNVGKSTLANRLFGRRERSPTTCPASRATGSSSRRSGAAGGSVWSTPRGTCRTPPASKSSRACKPTRAMREADLILLIVDAQAGITEEDAALARRLRRSSVPVLVVANKVDAAAEESDAAAFHALGLGAPVSVSGMHGRATGDLLDRIVELLPDAPEVREDDDLEPRFALVGRPNVGKSSLFNRLLGKERSVVFEEAGTTRDSVDDVIEWPTGRVRFVDTAGMRRQVKVKGVEYFSFVRATEAIDRANVVDPGDRRRRRLHRRRQEDRQPGDGRGPSVHARRQQVGPRRGEGPHVQGAQRDGRGLRERDGDADIGDAPARACTVCHRCCSTSTQQVDLRVPTAKVNEVIQQAQRERPTPARRRHAALRDAGRRRTPDVRHLRRRQRARPATASYLENRLRRTFGLEGVPIRLKFRPDAGSRARSQSARGAPSARPVHSPPSGRGAAWLARLSGGQKVAGSNPAGPTR